MIALSDRWTTIFENIANKLQLNQTLDLNNIYMFMNTAIRKIFELKPQALVKETFINLFSTVTQGTVSVVNGSNQIVGSGTNWTSAVVGKQITVGTSEIDYQYYNIISITGQTITIDSDYGQETASGQGYQIFQYSYNMPLDYWKPVALLGGGFPIIKMSDWEFVQQIPGFVQASPSQPANYRISAINLQLTVLSSPSQIILVSSNALDNMQATINGYNNGVPTTEVLTLTNLSPVTSVKTYSSLANIILNTAPAGAVNISYGSTTIGTISSGSLMFSCIVNYKILRISPKPDNSYPIQLIYYQEPPTMQNTTNLELLPVDFNDLVQNGAIVEGMRWYLGENNADYQASDAKWTKELIAKCTEETTLEDQDDMIQFSFGSNSVGKSGMPVDWISYLENQERMSGT